MNKGIIISIAVIILGFFFECFHLITDLRFFQFKFWVLGVGLIIVGSLGLLWFLIVPILEERAKQLGKFKKDQRKRK